MLNVGHNNPQVVNAIKEQLEKYLHICTLVATPEPYVQLAEMLNRLTPAIFLKKHCLPIRK